MELALTEVGSSETHTHVRLTGRGDIAGAGAIKSKFIGYTADRRQHAIVDIADVPLLTSMGLHVFLTAAKAMARDQKLLVLVGAQPLVEKTLRVAGLDRALPVVKDHAKAMEADPAQVRDPSLPGWGTCYRSPLGTSTGIPSGVWRPDLLLS
jgi:anti-anti-sigma factor